MEHGHDQQASKRRREGGAACTSAAGKGRAAASAQGGSPSHQRRGGSSSAGSSSRSGSSSSKNAVQLTSPSTGMKTTLPKECILGACRSVQDFVKLSNRIGEGTYGVVYRARDSRSGSVVALKQVKMEQEHGGMPVSTLREITLLRAARGHENIVTLLDVVVGRDLKMVFLSMEYCAHDLAALVDTLPVAFKEDQVKCLVLQLVRGVEWLHLKYIVHRDLKLSNLLLTENGILKVADFGMARKCGVLPPIPTPTVEHTTSSSRGGTRQAPAVRNVVVGARQLSPKVVTLWYRAPEILFGDRAYSFAVDMWGVGCVFGELLQHAPLMPGSTETKQLILMTELLGMPSPSIWPGLELLPHYSSVTLPAQRYNTVKEKFPYLGRDGLDLLNALLTYDPARRITAAAAQVHSYWHERPLPIAPEHMPTFPKDL